MCLAPNEARLRRVIPAHAGIHTVQAVSEAEMEASFPRTRESTPQHTSAAADRAPKAHP